jgi:cytochrome c
MDIILKAASIGVIAGAMTLAIASPASAADPSTGAKLFAAQCSVCHTRAANSPSGVGPRLFGVVGRKAGSLPGYSFSAAMKNSGLTWTPDQIRLYLSNPARTVRGNKMPYGGLHDDTKLGDLLAYLGTLK